MKTDVQERKKGILKELRETKWGKGSIAWGVFFLLAAYIFSSYGRQLLFNGAPARLVDSSTAKVIGQNYGDDRCLTREEVILIISDVFSHLKQSGFEKTGDTGAVMNQAIQIKMLEGDEDGYRIKDPAKKKEALVFIKRGLGIPEGLNLGSVPDLPDEILPPDDWSKQEIKELIAQGCFSIGEVIDLGNLDQPITISELKTVLNKVVEDNIEKIDSGLYAVLSNPTFQAVSAIVSPISTVLAILSFGLQLYDRREEKQKRQDEEQNEKEKELRIQGTICLAGSKDVGKSTLIEKMIYPAEPIYSVQANGEPTKTCHGDEIELHTNSGEVVFKGTILDGPGGSPEYVLKFLPSKEYENKILLLVLAHTKTGSDKEIDKTFIGEQLDDIKKIWAAAIRAHGPELNKVVVFINKNDLLERKHNPAEAKIYRKHFKTLCKACKEADVQICAVEGSSYSGDGLDKLYEQLRPIPSV